MSLVWPGTRRIAIDTHDLRDITAIDRASERDPRNVGLTPDEVARIWASIADLYRTAIYPALTFCLRYRGQVVLNRSIGYAQGLAPERPLAADARLAAPDTPVCLFSASKAVIALLIHKLAEEGGIDLDAPVSRYVPAFGAQGKTSVTIAEVLAHRGGFAYFDAGATGPEILTDWEACLKHICAMPVARARRWPTYHALTGGFVLGEIIRRVTGSTVQAYLDSRLRQPMNMRYFTYGLDRRSRSRAAVNHIAGQPVRWPISHWARRALSVSFEEVVAISNRDYFMDAVIPSGNLYATAEEMSRFYQMLLDDGVYRGRRLFEPATIVRMKQPVGSMCIDRALKIPIRYSEGLMYGMNPVGLFGPHSGPAYGHLGFMNILGWADPSRELAAGLMTTGKTIVGEHLMQYIRTLGTINAVCRERRR